MLIGVQRLEGIVVALCLLVTARTLHRQRPLGACAVQRAPTAWPDRTVQAAEGICWEAECTKDWARVEYAADGYGMQAYL
jgi:hypothetical protein